MSITGSDIIRERLRIWAHHGPLAALANDIGAPVNTLDAFVRTGVKPSPDILKALTAIILPHAAFDPSCDKLRPVATSAATPMGEGPPKSPPRPPPGEIFHGGKPPPLFPAPQKPVPKVPRPGWVE